jgi:hypothetical protein
MIINHNNLSVHIAKSISEVNRLRDTWEKLQWHPNADIDFFLTIIACRPEIINPHIFVMSQEGQVKAMIVGRIEKICLNFRLGYKTLAKPKVRQLNIIHGGILGDTTDETAKPFLNHIMEYLKKGDIDVVYLDHVRTDSYLYSLAKKQPSIFCRDLLPLINMRYQADVPESTEMFLKSISGKHRRSIHRLERALEKEYSGKIALKSYSDEKDVERLCIDTEVVAKKTYQRGIGTGFYGNMENRKRLALEAQKGWLRSYIAYINDEPSAFWIGTLYDKTFHLTFTGFDPVYKKFELGTSLFLKMVDDLCKQDVKKIDFGFGEAFYKQRFGHKAWEEASMYIFAPTLRGISINLLRTLTRGTVQFLKSVLTFSGIEQKLKTFYRKRLTKGNP